MTRNKKLVLLAEIIEQARQARGQDAVPEGVTPEMSSHVIRLIQNQRRDLNQSGHKSVCVGLRNSSVRHKFSRMTRRRTGSCNTHIRL